MYYLYSNGCAFCQVAKRMLEESGKDYQIKETSTDSEALADLQMLRNEFPVLAGNTQMPVLHIKNENGNKFYTGEEVINFFKMTK